MIYFYLFENEAELLDRVEKIATIVIAAFTLLFSIYIWYITQTKEDKRLESSRKVDFLKTIVLDNNLVYFFSFHEQILSFLQTFKGRQITDPERETINLLLIEELAKFRLKFFDLLLPFDKVLYLKVKDNADNLIDDLTNKIFDTQTDFFSIQNFSDSIEKYIIEQRNNSLAAICTIR